jgi:hypothetical protein
MDMKANLLAPLQPILALAKNLPLVEKDLLPAFAQDEAIVLVRIKPFDLSPFLGQRPSRQETRGAEYRHHHLYVPAIEQIRIGGSQHETAPTSLARSTA